MSVLIDNSITIYEALEHIKNGKYVMPAFQRQYVWSMEQIEKLWDSILLDYPIATFLFWHVDDNNVSWDTYFCNFLHEVTFDSRKQADNRLPEHMGDQGPKITCVNACIAMFFVGTSVSIKLD